MGWVEVAEATKWVGELTVEPLAGELTVTPARALEIKQQTMDVHQRLLLCIRTLHRSEGVARVSRVAAASQQQKP